MHYSALLLFFALLSISNLSAAQTLPAAQDLPGATAGPLAASDTVAAIHRLFAAKRHQSHILTGIIAGGGAIVLVGDGFSNGAVYLVLAAPYEIAILLLHSPYTKKAEARALTALQAHRLSPRLKKRLKARYFRQATIQPS